MFVLGKATNEKLTLFQLSFTPSVVLMNATELCEPPPHLKPSIPTRPLSADAQILAC